MSTLNGKLSSWPILQGGIGHLAPACPAQGAPSKENEIKKKKRINWKKRALKNTQSKFIAITGGPIHLFTLC